MGKQWRGGKKGWPNKGIGTLNGKARKRKKKTWLVEGGLKTINRENLHSFYFW